MGALNLGIIVVAVVLVLVVVGIVVLIASMRLRPRVRAWSELASQLGLACNRKGRPGAPVWLQGEYLGHPVIMDTYNESRHYRSSGQNRTTVQHLPHAYHDGGQRPGRSEPGVVEGKAPSPRSPNG